MLRHRRTGRSISQRRTNQSRRPSGSSYNVASGRYGPPSGSRTAPRRRGRARDLRSGTASGKGSRGQAPVDGSDTTFSRARRPGDRRPTGPSGAVRGPPVARALGPGRSPTEQRARPSRGRRTHTCGERVAESRSEGVRERSAEVGGASAHGARAAGTPRLTIVGARSRTLRAGARPRATPSRGGSMAAGRSRRSVGSTRTVGGSRGAVRRSAVGRSGVRGGRRSSFPRARAHYRRCCGCWKMSDAPRTKKSRRGGVGRPRGTAGTRCRPCGRYGGVFRGGCGRDSAPRVFEAGTEGSSNTLSRGCFASGSASPSLERPRGVARPGSRACGRPAGRSRPREGAA